MEKEIIKAHFDLMASQRPKWFKRNHVYHDQVIAVCRMFMDSNAKVLEMGCSTGQLIASLNPSFGVGIDLSPASIAVAQQMYSDLHWICADVEDLPDNEYLQQPFDLIIIEDLLGYLDDIQTFLKSIKRLSHSRTRVIISTWNWLWEPILQVGEQLHLKAPDLLVRQDWISASAIETFLYLTGYDILHSQPGLLFPYSFPLVSQLINSLSYAPLSERFTLLTTLVSRPIEEKQEIPCSVSIIIPTRNEAGNIQPLIERIPQMGTHTELIFVDGNSTDGTVEEIASMKSKYPEWDIKFIPQIPPNAQIEEHAPSMMLKLGKGDAVRKGFHAATGDLLMILDSDISVAPEDLPKFYEILSHDRARMANGTRFVYAQQSGAMKPVNRLGNVFFSVAFTWLLGQQVTDTLC